MNKCTCNFRALPSDYQPCTFRKERIAAIGKGPKTPEIQQRRVKNSLERFRKTCVTHSLTPPLLWLCAQEDADVFLQRHFQKANTDINKHNYETDLFLLAQKSYLIHTNSWTHPQTQADDKKTTRLLPGRVATLTTVWFLILVCYGKIMRTCKDDIICYTATLPNVL